MNDPRLARLIEAARAQDGQLVGGRLEPWSFTEWLRGVRDGQAAEVQRTGKPQQGSLC